MADPLHQVPIGIRDRLKYCIHDAFQGTDCAQGPATLALATALNACVHSYVSAELAQRNELVSLHRRLPGELWCTIWGWLPFVDRMRVLDVCTAWRSLARATPSIWSHVLCFSTGHNPDSCRCRDCINEDEKYASENSGWFDSPYPNHTTNLDAVCKAFSLGRNVPLHLSVDIVLAFPDTDVLRDISAACYAHADRIVSIHWRSCNSSTLGRFLSDLPRLLSLRRMVVEWLPDMDYEEEYFSCNAFSISDMIAPSIELPVLEHLNFDQFRFSRPGYAVPLLSALRSLSLVPTSPAILISVLKHCPRLTYLTVDFVHAYSSSITSESAIAEEFHAVMRATALITLQARRVGYVEEWALPALHDSRVREISLQYETYRDTHRGDRIFGDLKGSISLSCTMLGEECCVEASDDSQRTRRLLEPDSITVPLSRVHDSVSPNCITSLTVDLPMWPHVAKVPLGSNISTLTFIIPDRRALAAQIADGTDAAPFPSIATVYITSDPDWDPSLTTEHIIALVPQLGLALPIQHIVIDNRIARRGQSLPNQLALRTTVE